MDTDEAKKTARYIQRQRKFFQHYPSMLNQLEEWVSNSPAIASALLVIENEDAAVKFYAENPSAALQDFTKRFALKDGVTL